MNEKPAAATTAYHAHYDEAVRFRDEAFTPAVIGRGEHLQGMVVGFHAGQFIPAHAPGLDITLVVLEGEGVLATDEGDRELRPGSVAFIAAGHTRGIRAVTEMKTFQVVSPLPTHADHEGVRRGLQAGAPE